MAQKSFLNGLLQNNFIGGFTLIEMLFSLAFVAVLAGVSIPLYQSLQVNNDLELATFNLARNLRRAQLLARAVAADSQWGVKVQPGTITIFEGSSYAARTAVFDEVTDIADSIAPSGISEVVFSKLYGEPAIMGDIILRSVTNQTRTTTIGIKGVVSY